MTSIPSQFPEWLALAARDGLGGSAAEPPALTLGTPYVLRLPLPASATFGNWTGGAFSARLRAAPGADGAALATFVCATGTPSGGVTPVTFTLEPEDQGDLPDPPVGLGVAEAFLSIDFTPTAGDAIPIRETRLLYKARV